MLNTKRGGVAVLVLAFLFVLGFSAPSRADEPAAVAKTFYNKLLAGRSVWSMLTTYRQDAFVQMSVAQIIEQGIFDKSQAKEVEAFVKQEMAKEGSEMSKAAWEEARKNLAGLDTVVVKNVIINGDTASVTINDSPIPLLLFKVGGDWKVGLVESVQSVQK